MAAVQKKRLLDLVFGTWNVNGLGLKAKDDVKKKSILLEAQLHGILCLAIAETKGTKTGEETAGDWKIYHAGGQKCNAGVAIAVSNKFPGQVVDWRKVSPRIVYVDFKIKAGRPFRVICCYAPTDDKDETQKLEFYAQLSATVAPATKCLLLGDFNARLPLRTDFAGPWGRNEIANRNTPLLEGFLQENNACSLASYFRHSFRSYATWRHPGHKTLNLGHRGYHQIDHAIAPRGFKNAIKDCKALDPSEKSKFDHRLVVVKVSQRDLQWFGRKKKNKPTPRIPTAKAATLDEKNFFNSEFEKGLQKGDTLQNSLREAGTKVFEKSKTDRKPWISVEFTDLWQERCRLLAAGEKAEALEILKLMKWVKRKDRQAFAERVCADAEDFFEQRGLSPAIAEIAKLGGKKKVARGPKFSEPLSHGSRFEDLGCTSMYSSGK